MPPKQWEMMCTCTSRISSKHLRTVWRNEAYRNVGNAWECRDQHSNNISGAWANVRYYQGELQSQALQRCLDKAIECPCNTLPKSLKLVFCYRVMLNDGWILLKITLLLTQNKFSKCLTKFDIGQILLFFFSSAQRDTSMWLRSHRHTGLSLKSELCQGHMLYGLFLCHWILLQKKWGLACELINVY